MDCWWKIISKFINFFIHNPVKVQNIFLKLACYLRINTIKKIFDRKIKLVRDLDTNEKNYVRINDFHHDKRSMLQFICIS